MSDDLVRFAVGAGVFFGLCGLAIWRGGWPERTVAITLVVAILVSPMVQMHPGGGDSRPELWMFLIDVTFMLVCVGVALRSDRWWPLFCSAYALLVAFSHVARNLNQDIEQFTFLSGNVLWSYGTVLALGLGVLEVERRRRRKTAF